MALSIAIVRAGANAVNLPLYKHIATIA